MGDSIKLCPFCAEEIKAAAIVCKHCGRDLPVADLSEKPSKKRRRGCSFWQLAVGLLLLIGCGLIADLSEPQSSNRIVRSTVATPQAQRTFVTRMYERITLDTPTPIPTQTVSMGLEQTESISRTNSISKTIDTSSVISVTLPAKSAAAIRTPTEINTTVPTSTPTKTPTSTLTPVPLATNTPIPTTTSAATSTQTPTVTPLVTNSLNNENPITVGDVLLVASTPLPTIIPTPIPTLDIASSFELRVNELAGNKVLGVDDLQVRVVDMSTAGIDGYDVYLTWELSTSWGEERFKRRARFAVRNILVAFNESDITNYNELILFADAELVDKFGNVFTDRVLKAVYHRDNVSRINPDYFVADDVFAITDNYWLHPVLRDESEEVQAPSYEWYEGGTLHQATKGEWLNALERNKLATSADWAAAMFDLETVEGMAMVAPQLMVCVDEAIQAESLPLNYDIREVAALCAVLLQPDN